MQPTLRGGAASSAVATAALLLQASPPQPCAVPQKAAAGDAPGEHYSHDAEVQHCVVSSRSQHEGHEGECVCVVVVVGGERGRGGLGACPHRELVMPERVHAVATAGAQWAVVYIKPCTHRLSKPTPALDAMKAPLFEEVITCGGGGGASAQVLLPNALLPNIRRMPEPCALGAQLC